MPSIQVKKPREGMIDGDISGVPSCDWLHWQELSGEPLSRSCTHPVAPPAAHHRAGPGEQLSAFRRTPSETVGGQLRADLRISNIEETLDDCFIYFKSILSVASCCS